MRTIEEVIAELRKDIHSDVYLGNKTINTYLDEILEIHKAVRPHGEWIPVSERLPTIDAENGWKASDVVLVFLADGKMHMGFYCDDKKWRFCESGEEKEPFWKDVIAWMPLPEPYKEEADNVKPCSSCAHFNNGNRKPYPCGSCFINSHNMWEAENE
jgi:hypothetical protein